MACSAYLFKGNDMFCSEQILAAEMEGEQGIRLFQAYLDKLNTVPDLL